MSQLTFNQKFSSEESCIDFLEKIRWAQGYYCPHCSSTKVYKYRESELFKCAHCDRQFSVKTGTIFSGSKIPVSKWLRTIYLLTYKEEGISSADLQRQIDVTQKTAWKMLRKIEKKLKRSSARHMLVQREPARASIHEISDTYLTLNSLNALT